MRFQSNGKRLCSYSGKRIRTDGKGEHDKDSDRTLEFSMEGLFNKVVHSKKSQSYLSSFSHFQPDEHDHLHGTCKLCYEKITVIYENKKPIMVNTIDNQYHRVWVGSGVYCKMGKEIKK